VIFPKAGGIEPTASLPKFTLSLNIIISSGRSALCMPWVRRTFFFSFGVISLVLAFSCIMSMFPVSSCSVQFGLALTIRHIIMVYVRMCTR